MGMIKRVWVAIRNKMDIDLTKARLSIECAHSNLEPCNECDVQSWADRW